MQAPMSPVPSNAGDWLWLANASMEMVRERRPRWKKKVTAFTKKAYRDLDRRSVMSPTGADALAGYSYVDAAAALVSQSALSSNDLMKQHRVEPTMVHPAETAKGPNWNDLCEPGVKGALG